MSPPKRDEWFSWDEVRIERISIWSGFPAPAVNLYVEGRLLTAGRQCGATNQRCDQNVAQHRRNLKIAVLIHSISTGSTSMIHADGWYQMLFLCSRKNATVL